MWGPLYHVVTYFMIRIIGGTVGLLTSSETVAQRYPYQALRPEALTPQA